VYPLLSIHVVNVSWTKKKYAGIKIACGGGWETIIIIISRGLMLPPHLPYSHDLVKFSTERMALASTPVGFWNGAQGAFFECEDISSQRS